VKARARVIGGFVRFGNRRNRKDAAASGGAKETGAPKARLLLAAFAALAATLVLGVALAGAVAPVVTVEDADDVEYTTAHVEGEVNPEGHETSFHFEYITDDQYLANEANSEPLFQGATEVGHGSTEVTVSPSESLSGLKPATEYHLRLVATNNEGETAEAVAASTFTTKAVAKPQVSALAATETHFSGMVNPNAPEAAPATDSVKAGFNTHWRFTCSPDCNFSGSSEGDLEAGNSAIEVSADPVNLTPNQAYDVTLHATNAGGEETETLTAAFTTPGLAPEIGDATQLDPTATSIVLAGTVNPHNAPLSDCHFAYGQAGTLDHSAPCELPLPESEGKKEVRAAIEGLEPGTDYSYQLIATNAFGTAEGTIRTFHTFAEPTTGPACPNEAIRIAQHATQLRECRAWEQVSPVDKGDGDIIAEQLETKASADGDAAAFESKLGFGDTVGSGTVGQSTYMARRGASGWSTHSLLPESDPEALQTLFASNRVEVYAEDLSNAFLWAYDLPAVADDAKKQMNIYAEDTATRGLRTVSKTQVEEPNISTFLSTEYAGYSDDAKHFAFSPPFSGFGPPPQLLPDARPGVTNVYKWDDGVLSVAGKLPDGEVPPAGAAQAAFNSKYTMSADGSRLAFVASPDGSAPSQLYLQVDGAPSVWVSEPETSDNDDKTPRNGIVFQGMTPDGKNVFFASDEPLLDEDNAPGPDLYRFTYSADPENNDNLTLITNNGSSSVPSTGGVLVGMSDDARRVYIHQSDSVVKLWQEGVPGLTVVDPTPFQSLEPFKWLALLASEPGHGRVSPDGNWLAYINKNGRIYLYDREGDSLSCASCPSGATIVPTVTHTGGRALKGFRPRFLSDDGQVFFTSTGSLVPEDTNGVADVYEYDGETGTLSLLSTGKGSEPAMFADASRSGADVFIVTRQQLVKSDRDEYVDLYDVRAGGGFEESESGLSPCSGEACQGAAPASPAGPAIVSGAAARGNLRQIRCAKNKHKVRRKGKVRCVKKQKRYAHTDRRAAR
jgi:hypothetical protein